MVRRIGPRAGWVLWVLTALLWLVSLAFWASNGFPRLPGSDPSSSAGDTLTRVLFIVIFVAIATLGALILSRQPDNPIGWICVAAPILQAAPIVESDVAVFLMRTQSSPLLAVALGWLASWSILSATTLIGPILLLLPNGSLASPRWKPVLWLSVLSVALASFTFAFAPGPLRALQVVDNPIALSSAGPLLDQLHAIASVLIPLGFVLAAVSLVGRFRGARGEERQQLKWIAYGAVVWIVAYVVTATRIAAAVTQVVYLLAFASFVAALGFAILKYRLYDIDVVINKTLVYGALAVCITVLYVLVVTGVGTLIGTRGEPNLVLSLLATALVAAAFQPLRERLQRIANRLVYGQRSSPYEVLADFSRRVSEALSVDTVLPQMAEAAARGVGAARARVRVYVPGGQDQAVAWPAQAVGESFDRTVPVVHQTALVGEIAIAKKPGDPLTPTESALLADLAAQAGPALSNVRLALDLRTRAEELRASRQRIVTAQDAERRRLERDIHDGAQQHLVAIAVNLQVADELIESDPVEARALVAEVRGQATDALDTLRDLARGIYPPALRDHGVVAALEAYVAKLNPLVTCQADTDVAHGRYPPGVEAAMYFCVLEALQNAAKYAAHAAVHVSLRATSGRVTFSVADDGPGFDAEQAHAGTGLLGMADRLAALDGYLDVVARPGAGTTVSGWLPVEPATSNEN